MSNRKKKHGVEAPGTGGTKTQKGEQRRRRKSSGLEARGDGNAQKKKELTPKTKKGGRLNNNEKQRFVKKRQRIRRQQKEEEKEPPSVKGGTREKESAFEPGGADFGEGGKVKHRGRAKRKCWGTTQAPNWRGVNT